MVKVNRAYSLLPIKAIIVTNIAKLSNPRPIQQIIVHVHLIGSHVMESHRIVGHLAWPVWISYAADISGRAAHSNVIGHMATVGGRGFVAVVVRRACSALECMPLEPGGGQVRDQVGLQRLRKEGHPATHKLRGENAAF
jgi:hypothetical protein